MAAQARKTEILTSPCFSVLLSVSKPGVLAVRHSDHPVLRLAVIGALVVEEGGALCHAAIVSREFGLAAVIGAHRATTRIPHAAHVEVDPRQGTVRLL